MDLKESLDLISSNPTSNTDLVDADYDIGDFGTTAYDSVLDTESTGYNAFRLGETGVTYVNEGGNIAKFGARMNWDTAETFEGEWVATTRVGRQYSSADTAGDPSTDYAPRLSLTIEANTSYLAMIL